MPYSQQHIEKFDSIDLNFILTEKTGHIFTITLNRSDKRNAFTPTMVNEIAFALAYAQATTDIWCVVIAANGPVFCAGMDLNVFQNPQLDTPNSTLPNFNPELTFGDALAVLKKPSIAKVQGNVFAGGFLIIGACTFVVASADAQFSLPEVKRGIFPMQVLQVLLKMMTARKAMQLCILAETLDASQAKEYGIVTHIAENNDIESVCEELIHTILSHSPFAISRGIHALDDILNMPAGEINAFLYDQLKTIRESEDAQEGINAFREKREPEWKNK